MLIKNVRYPMGSAVPTTSSASQLVLREPGESESGFVVWAKSINPTPISYGIQMKPYDVYGV